MTMKPKIGVLYAPGTNCHEEAAFAVEQAGGEAEFLLLAELLAGRETFAGYQGLIFPGGFSYGDHIAAGRIFAVHLLARLTEALQEFLFRHRPILGVCNGDQVLMETGLLPVGAPGKHTAALTQNRSARFEGRWVTLLARGGSFWTEGLHDRPLRLPSAHGEGRLVLPPGTAAQPAFCYTEDGVRPTEAYPANPAGSPGGLAGVTDPTGLILGLMPHPERAILPAHGSKDGRGIFTNLVRFCAGM
jgi:phosphoribosylformylglycinamidine synthase